MRYNNSIRQSLLKNKGGQYEVIPPPLPKPKKKKRFWLRLFILIFFLTFALGLGGVVGIGFSLTNMPDVTQLQYYKPIETTFIYDSKKNILARLHDEENRVIIPLKEIPVHVQKAVMAIEDARFMEHKGVDLLGLLRAVKNNILGRKLREGGSTITQQLAKNLFLTPERTVSRKIAEAWISMEIEKKYSKEQILELYLNQVYWGHNAYGIEAAAQIYFGKSARNLSIAEGAMLAGILKGPEIFSPYKNYKLAVSRQESVLNNMVENKFISPNDEQAAKKVKLTLTGLGKGHRFPYFTTYVLNLLHEKFSESQLRQGGLRVYTTLDPDAQAFAEKLIAKKVLALRNYNAHQGALVCLDPRTGYIKAMVGGVDFHKSQFNRAFQAQRQVGSAFKPFVYLTAFAQGFSPGSIEIDAPISYKVGTKIWKPKNFGGGYGGPMTLQRALERSVNIIAVKLIDQVGIQNVIDTARALGIQSQLGHNLSLALGSSEVTLLEMASAYGTIATGGLRISPTPILRIEDRDGNVIEDNTPNPVQVFNRDAVLSLIRVMKGVPIRGTAPTADIGRPVAGKTGTTDDHYDAWFIGFIPQLVTAVWVGNDNPSEMLGATGGEFCAPIWAEFMRYITRNMPVKDFPGAEGLLSLIAIDTKQLKEKLKALPQESQDAIKKLNKQYESLLKEEEIMPSSSESPEVIEELKPVANPTPISVKEENVPSQNQPPIQTNAPQNPKKNVEELDNMIKELEDIEKSQ